MSLTLTYYGHSTFTVHADGVNIVLDPFFAPNNPLAPVGAEGIQADFILQTHGHVGPHCRYGQHCQAHWRTGDLQFRDRWLAAKSGW
jgi:L-ascorbate metabolism protein UlaG (beta-lactamase superfamily)